MEGLKKKASNKGVEILCDEAQIVMSSIPSVIIRWGMTVMAVIVGVILIVSGFIKWPKAIESTFEGRIIENKAFLKTSLSPETLNYLLNVKKQNVYVFSPMFQQKYATNGINGIINQLSVHGNSNNQYDVTITVLLNSNDIRTDSILYGEIQFLISEKTLLQLLYGNIKIGNSF